MIRKILFQICVAFFGNTYNIRHLVVWLSLITLINASCVRSRLPKKSDYVYAGATIKLKSDTAIDGKRSLKNMLKDQTYPLPNSTMAGFPVKLWVYSIFGLGYIGSNYGEKPVLLSDVPVNEVAGSLHTVLKANGYLDARVEASIKKTFLFKFQRKVVYHVYLQPPYFLRQINNGIEDTSITSLIHSAKSKPRIHPNDQYNLIKLKDERERIDRILKNHGYYYFSPDYLYYFADSTVGHRRIDLTMKLQKDVDPADCRPWTIKNVTVVDKLVTDTLQAKKYVNYKGIDFTTSKAVNPKNIGHFILFKPGDLLTTENFNITNRSLTSLGAYLYVNIDAAVDTTEDNMLSLQITLTPHKRKYIKANLDMVSRSNNFAGPQVGLSFVNRNLFGGSEQLTYKVNGSIEAWLQQQDSKMLGRYSYEIGSSIELKYPRFIFLSPSLFSGRYIPSNHIRLEARMVNQALYYKMWFMNGVFGYRWTETVSKHHEFNLADITFQHTLKTTAIYDSVLNINPLLKQSFADQFVIGSNYTYEYAVPEKDRRKLKMAFSGTLDISGNLLYGLQRAFGAKRTNGEPLKVFGVPYSEYARAIVDYRVYLTLFKGNKLASRLNVGVGLPLGNSITLPALKQFYLGGANTLRAFKFRSVGPGAYENPLNIAAVLVNHTGELELLGSIEDRWRFAKRLELALFVDAGNIWVVKNDPLRENAQFNSRLFYKQLAVGWGYGLRYINEFFVFRIDVGIPLHSPDTTQKIADMKPIFNFAIGYPF